MFPSHLSCRRNMLPRGFPSTCYSKLAQPPSAHIYQPLTSHSMWFLPLPDCKVLHTKQQSRSQIARHCAPRFLTPELGIEPPQVSESVGSLPRKVTSVGFRFRNLAATGNQSRVTDGTRVFRFGKWLFSAMARHKRGILSPGEVAVSWQLSSSGGGLFGRPAISKSGALLICGATLCSPLPNAAQGLPAFAPPLSFSGSGLEIG